MVLLFLSLIIFFVKDFSGTTAPSILKFCTNTKYDFLYRVRENQHSHVYLFCYSFFSFAPIFFFLTDFSALMGATVFKFYIHVHRVESYCVKENQEAEIYFAFLLPFFHLSLGCNA